MRLGNYVSNRVISLIAGLVLVLFTGPAMAANLDDQFILGYATAILEQQFKVKAGSLQVTNGMVAVQAEDLGAADREKVVNALKEIRGVANVEVINGTKDASPLTEAKRAQSPAVEIGETKPENGGKFLPEGRLFEPLLADPHWPHFSMAYQRYIDDVELESVAAISLGTIVELYEGDFFAGGRWQAGIQGGVSAIFDLDAPSSDLVNADYWLGFPLSYRVHNFSAMLRPFHQSSHLGDEYLLRTRTNRVNVSYEGVDLRLSYELFDKAVRPYIGGGYIFRKEPSDLKPLSAQGGIEIRSPKTIFGKHMRPIVAVDVQGREETDWDLDFSARAGLQFETEKLRGRYFQLMFEYYNGHSPNGQFFERNIEYWGVGFHFYYD